MIKIWNREDALKGIDKEVWFEAYPESKVKTLALIDNVEVVFVEDLKEQGFNGDTDEAIVQAYIDDRKQKEEEISKKKDKDESTIADLKKTIENMKVEHSKQIAELIEKSEQDKLELSTAIVEMAEQLNSEA